jgi:hypothetical protein
MILMIYSYDQWYNFLSNHILMTLIAPIKCWLINTHKMDKSDIVNEIQSIHKEGFCEKQSRFLKSWRK